MGKRKRRFFVVVSCFILIVIATSIVTNRFLVTEYEPFRSWRSDALINKTREELKIAEVIRTSKQIKKHGDTYITSLPKEVIQALSLEKEGRLDFIVCDGQVSLEKSLAIKPENSSNGFSDDINFFMNKHDKAFRNLVEK